MNACVHWPGSYRGKQKSARALYRRDDNTGRRLHHNQTRKTEDVISLIVPGLYDCGLLGPPVLSGFTESVGQLLDEESDSGSEGPDWQSRASMAVVHRGLNEERWVGTSERSWWPKTIWAGDKPVTFGVLRSSNRP